jgi:hypothetical protein
MQPVRLYSSLLAVALAIACASPAESGSAPLDGTWVGAAEKASPSGSYVRALTFGPAGSFTSEFRSYGVYQGEPSDELSGYQRTEGTYRAEGDRLTFQPARLVVWDGSNGVASPERVIEPYPYGSVFDDARYEIVDGQLSLHFTIYPADGPVPTVWVFTRSH